MAVKLTFAERIDDLIYKKKQEGMTEASIAKAIGIKAPTLTAYKNGDRTPNYENLLRLSNYFDVSLDWLGGLDNYQNKKTGRMTAKALGLSSEAVTSMRGYGSISPAINLLVEYEMFELLLKSIVKFYYSCEADYTVQEATHRYRVLNNGTFPTHQQVSIMLGELALDNRLDCETQAKLFVLSDRFEKAEDATIFASEEEDNAFLNKLQMKDLYELQISKYLHQLTEELEKSAARKIKELSLFDNELPKD